LVEFETRYHGRVCATTLDIFTKNLSVSSVTMARRVFAIVPWNTTDLTGRINTARHVLSVTGVKRDASASSRLIAAA